MVTFFRAGWPTDALQQRSLYQCALKVVGVGLTKLAGGLMLCSREVGTSALEDIASKNKSSEDLV